MSRRDLRKPGQGAPRQDRRGDDGLQARPRGDGRRPRRRGHAAPREGHGERRQARRPRDHRGQGRLPIADDGSTGAMVAVGCETEPVSNNEEFFVYVEGRPRRGRHHGAQAPRRARGRARRAVRQARREHRRRGAVRFEGADGEVLAGVRAPAREQDRRAGPARGGDPDVARKLAMHIAASRPPQWIDAGRRARGGTVTSERDIFAKHPTRCRQAGGGRDEDRRGESRSGCRADASSPSRSGSTTRRQDGRPGAAGGGVRGDRVPPLRPGRVGRERPGEPGCRRSGRPVPPRPAEALRRGADGRPRVRRRPEDDRVARAGDRRGAAGRARDRDRDRGREHRPRDGGGRRRNGPRDRRLRRDARDRPQLADDPGRARAQRRRHARACRRSPSRRSRSRTSAAARSATSRRGGS